MDGILTIVLRTIVLYMFIFLVFRVMGKRETIHRHMLDLVVLIMMAELAVMSIEDPHTPMLGSIIAMCVMIAIWFFSDIVFFKNKKAPERPTTIIDQGKIDENQMRKLRYNYEDLLNELRENHVQHLSEVEFAILEPTGKLSVYQHDTGLNQFPSGNSNIDVPLPLILDGHVQKEHLERIHQTPLWLRQQLRNVGYKDIKNISYCELQQDGTFFIGLKNDL